MIKMLFCVAKLADLFVNLQSKIEKMTKKVFSWAFMLVLLLLFVACKTAERCNCG